MIAPARQTISHIQRVAGIVSIVHCLQRPDDHDIDGLTGKTDQKIRMPANN